jgi:hypothetical protein
VRLGVFVDEIVDECVSVGVLDGVTEPLEDKDDVSVGDIVSVSWSDDVGVRVCEGVYVVVQVEVGVKVGVFVLDGDEVWVTDGDAVLDGVVVLDNVGVSEGVVEHVLEAVMIGVYVLVELDVVN